MSVDQVPESLRGGGWRTSVQLELTPILRAALDAFNEHGFHGTTVRDIARRVGVTVPALYYHHANKEAILFALQDASLDRLTSLCEAAVADAGDDVVGRFLNLVEAIGLYMANSTKLAALDAEIRSLTPELRAVYSTKRRALEQMLIGAVEEGRALDHFHISSPTDTARALFGMFQAIATWYHAGGQIKPANLAARYVDIAAHAVGGSQTVLDRARGIATS
ncbi:TetR/AcrR family transcriptional regulator [Rhodococcoides fascians]|uniref:TetR/AcrR family transcriptional regulator n=1 Tax=Rhodococcoides fascians TaxID=1828 RepID=UPI00068E384A|nr:TetR/AcrR family transcriptional regulator [Rhodococcus fascians]